MSPQANYRIFSLTRQSTIYGGDSLILDNIRAKCVEKEISIYALERQLGFGNRTVSSWATSSPSIDKLKKVADFFGVTVDELLADRYEAGQELNVIQHHE